MSEAGDRDDEHRSRHLSRGVGQRLREGEVRVERSGGQPVQAVELAGVRDPLVDQDEAWRVRPEEVHERLSRVRPGAIGVGDERMAVCAAELPGQLAPQGADVGSVGLARDGRGLEPVTDENRGRRAGRRSQLRLGEHALDARQVRGRVAGREVQQRDERVGLAAAEVRLQRDDRIPALGAQATDRVDREAAQSLGEVRPAKELPRVSVLVGGVPAPDLMQIGGELGLLVAPRSDVAVRRDDLTPRSQAGLRRALDGDGRTAAP